MGQKRYRIQGSAGDPDVFLSTTEEKEQVVHVQEQIKAIIEECFPSTDALANHIEALGIPVIHKTAAPLRMMICMKVSGCELGYMSPLMKNYQKFVDILKQFCPDKASCDFSKGFILTLDEGYHFAFLTSQFYHAMAFKCGLSGYSNDAVRLYRLFEGKFHCQLHPKLLEKLSYEDKLELRYAIRREKESLAFLRFAVEEVFIPKNNARLLEKGEAQA